MTDRKGQTDTTAIIRDILLHIETELSIPSIQCPEGCGPTRFQLFLRQKIVPLFNSKRAKTGPKKAFVPPFNSNICSEIDAKRDIMGHMKNRVIRWYYAVFCSFPIEINASRTEEHVSQL